MAEKKPEFVVSDRRKFTDEGELRTETREESSQSCVTEVAPQPFDPMPQPPSRAEQEAQHVEYRASGKKIDDMLSSGGHGKAEDFEMTLDRLIQSLYVSALIQMGMMHPEGEAPRPDIVSARQTIDTLGVLKDKTKGNLTSAEENLLQNVLFELRMAFLELTDAITRAPGVASNTPIAK
jgi:hypothetical protein